MQCALAMLYDARPLQLVHMPDCQRPYMCHCPIDHPADQRLCTFLQAYTGLKTLYLECNALDRIEGLRSLTNLRCLYLGKNMISEVEGLDSLLQLETLDLSENRIETLSGLRHLPQLKTLALAGECHCAWQRVGSCVLSGTSAAENPSLAGQVLVLAQTVSEQDGCTARAQAPVVTLAGEECLLTSRNRFAACKLAA